MPKYVYYCKNCENDFEIKHMLQETCIICSFCATEGQLERKPAEIFLTKKHTEFAATLKDGDVIKATIEETRLDTIEEKQRLRKREYKK
tara:strand:- start:421 stop:687 length:267 start_codon:yes stop_codon:yes gene_type:complete